MSIPEFCPVPDSHIPITTVGHNIHNVLLLEDLSYTLQCAISAIDAGGEGILPVIPVVKVSPIDLGVIERNSSRLFNLARGIELLGYSVNAVDWNGLRDAHLRLVTIFRTLSFSENQPITVPSMLLFLYVKQLSYTENIIEIYAPPYD